MHRDLLRFFRSCATWLQQAGVDMKDAQGLLRHSRASTTQDIYQQIVPESQRKAVAKLTDFVRSTAQQKGTSGGLEMRIRRRKFNELHTFRKSKACTLLEVVARDGFELPTPTLSH